MVGAPALPPLHDCTPYQCPLKRLNPIYADLRYIADGMHRIPLGTAKRALLGPLTTARTEIVSHAWTVRVDVISMTHPLRVTLTRGH